MIEGLRRDLTDLMRVPGLSGHEDRVRRAIAGKLTALGLESQSDTLGNLWTTFHGSAPSVMLFTHMDQLGFIVRRLEADGFLRIERLGGVPVRALPAQEVLLCGRKGDVPGIIAHKSHHATQPGEKDQVLPIQSLYIDAGFTSAEEARAAGVEIGTPVVYAPSVTELAYDRIAGTSVDDRAGCAVLLAVAEALAKRSKGPTVHVCFTTLEEFNLRGAQPLAQRLEPDIALQIDLALAADTPDMPDAGEVTLGGGPCLSLYSFHGRGTLNGVIPHPVIVRLIEESAEAASLPLQRSAATGVLTDLSYVQLTGHGVASADLCFPMRYSHSAREVCDLKDLADLTTLLTTALARITPDFSLDRDEVT
ncbi:M42 family metallopeptidase [Pseudaestuariivita sp.]|uniref:M42 family metallopeptidase n=1 Tax=Pseudaestuariivita sp. TaxID=2211669 RepID=UPI004059085F